MWDMQIIGKGFECQAEKLQLLGQSSRPHAVTQAQDWRHGCRAWCRLNKEELCSKIMKGSTWVTLSVKHPALGFGPVHDFMVVGSSLALCSSLTLCPCPPQKIIKDFKAVTIGH